MPCAIGWSDIGSWAAVGELTEADQSGNRVHGKALLHDTTDCYIQSANRLVGAVGVSDLIIIDTPDALLVANRHRSQDVKQIYAQLKTLGTKPTKCIAPCTAFGAFTPYSKWGHSSRSNASRSNPVRPLACKCTTIAVNTGLSSVARQILSTVSKTSCC